MNIMKNLKITLLSICVIFLSLNLSACGQKGPLIVEKPPVAQVETLDGIENTDKIDAENETEAEAEAEAEDLEADDE